MQLIPKGRFTIVHDLPCMTCGVVALDWENLYRKKGRGYFPRKGVPVFLYMTLRRQDSRTRTWALWDGGTVITSMPIGTDVATLQRASRYMMEQLYRPVREFKGWEPVLATMAAMTPGQFPPPPPVVAIPAEGTDLLLP